MLAAQRHREILNRLRKDGGVRVTSLAADFNVTEATIRRDLEKLEQDGELSRIHGGAVPSPVETRELPFDVRQTTNLAEKRAIAEHALRHVSEGDVLAVDASSTAFELTRLLPDIPLTVVTNAMLVALALRKTRSVHVVLTGGLLDAPSLSLTGTLTERSLDTLNVGKFFFSSKGIHPERGLSEASETQSRFKRLMLNAAQRAYLLVDNSKFMVRSMVSYATLGELDVLVTDREPPVEIRAQLERLGVQVEWA